MRRLAGHAGKYIVLLFMLVCFGHILSAGTVISGYGTPVIYYLDKSPYSIDLVKDMKKNDETLENYLPFTACGSLEEQSFSNPDLGRDLTCEMLYIYGSSSFLCTASGELLADDLSGCVLSSEAAWQLFGETNVTGGEIIYNEQTFYIRGVCENDTALVILPAEAVFKEENETDRMQSPNDLMDGEDVPSVGGETEKAAFDKIIIKPIEEGAVRSEYIQAFENRWGISSKTDCLIYQRLSSFFMMLIPALILIVVMLKGLTFIIRNHYRPFWLISGMVGLAVMFLAFFIICQTTPSIPADLIPNRWSDFDFWGDTIETFQNSIQHIIFMNKTEIELSYFKPLTGLMAYTLAGVILFFITNQCFRVTGSRQLFYTLAGTCITEIIVIYILRQNDLVLATKQMLLYLWPYLLVGKFVFYMKKTVD